MVYGFTGASKPPAGFEQKIADVIAGLSGRNVFVTGSQVGVDEEVARLALAYYPDAAHIQIVPGAPGTTGKLFPETRWIQLPAAKTKAAVYRARNEEIVRYAETLIVFPEGPEDAHPRSGTWMTVRIARKAGIPIWVFPLYDAESWTEGGR